LEEEKKSAILVAKIANNGFGENPLPKAILLVFDK